MSTVPYNVIAASKPFRFLVGPSKKEFFIHSELVAQASKPLWILVNGEWKEGKEGVVEWSEVDEETFSRFCEFAYTGNYHAAEPIHDTPSALLGIEEKPSSEEVIEASSTAESRLEREPEDQWSTWATSTKVKKKGIKSGISKKDTMLEAFRTGDRECILPEVPTSNLNPSTDYSEVLLSHTHLYAFADCYDIEKLMILCVRKLRAQLILFNLHGGARANDIAQLIDYSYKNTRSESFMQDNLRSMLSTYVACHIEELWSNVYFQDVLGSGEVSRDIIGKLLKRLD
ncbi:hypothetical protein F4805DRAFT_392030 [Annulohypoxylon moriforme]|nr:hypothetical protein F4805DRAFT_392030 [Annulohypoxylon moriforme]